MEVIVMPTYHFKQLSDHALFVQFGATINEEIHKVIQQAIFQLQQRPFPGLIEIVPSYTNFCVDFSFRRSRIYRKPYLCGASWCRV